MKRCLWLIGFVLFAAFFAKAQNDTVIFSVPGGFYEDVFQLELYNYYPQNHIRYTINGNRPTAQSPLYEEALVLDEHLFSNADIYTIINCPEQDFYLPDSVRHCIVIRAAVFDENDSCISAVKTNSYFIRALGCDTHGLPAVSLCLDSLDLFDNETGIFVPGIHYDPLNPNWSGNYYQEGREWERQMNVEFYELNNTGINQQAGLRTHGGNGRRFQQKNLKMYARDEYGKKRFKHSFFETLPNDSFKHLILRPFASSGLVSGTNDHLCNQIAAQLNVEALASRPVVLFINGEYWGIYYIHERSDERYLEDHFDVDINNVNLISGWNGLIDHGTPQNYNALYQWLETACLSNEEDYAYFKTQIDLDCFIDYQILELFIENNDWPANNMRMWQEGHGPWRWIFYDGDACLRWMTFHAFDQAVYVGDATWPSSTVSTLFFRKLLENVEFKQQFEARFVALLNTVFDYSNTGVLYESIRTALEQEIPFQSARFGMPESVGVWNDNMNMVNYFLMNRAANIEFLLNDFLWDLPEQQVSSWCYPNPSSGEIHLSVDVEGFGADEIAIYDLMGQKVFGQVMEIAEGQNEFTIHPSISSGVYILRIGNQVQRIVRY